MIHLTYFFDVCRRNKVIFFRPPMSCILASSIILDLGFLTEIRGVEKTWTLPKSWRRKHDTHVFSQTTLFWGGYNKIHCFYLVAGGVWQNPQGLCSCFGRSIWLMHPNRYSARQNLWEMLGRITGSQHLSPITIMDLKNNDMYVYCKELRI